MALAWNCDKGVKFMLDRLTVACYLHEPSALRLLVGLNGAETAEDRLDFGDGLQFRLLCDSIRAPVTIMSHKSIISREPTT